MQYVRSTKILSITAGELLALQNLNLEKYGEEEFFCIILQEILAQMGNANAFTPHSSAHVIDQFKKATPKRFKRGEDDSSMLDDHLLSKYQTAYPRISLLKALAPEYEFSFRMV
jgi:hypothetical protein